MITLGCCLSATISAVKIRAVTLGLDLPKPEVDDAPFSAAGRFLAQARKAFADHDIEVQTTRVCGADLESATAAWAEELEKAAKKHGIEYLSIGRFPTSAHAFVAEELPSILASSEILFASADLIGPTA